MASVLSHPFICVLQAAQDRIDVAKLNLDQLPALWVVLPEVTQVDKRALNQIVIEHIALDCLDRIRAFHVDLRVDRELTGPLSDPIDLLFELNFAVFLRLVQLGLHVSEAIPDDTCEHVVAQLTHQDCPCQMHVGCMTAVAEARAHSAIQDVAQCHIDFQLFFHFRACSHQGLKSQEEWRKHSNI